MSWEDDGGWLVYSDLEGCVRHGRQWTETDGSLLVWTVQTCNPAHFSCSGVGASETSYMSAQAVAYDVKILQFGTCFVHEEIYQFRYVISSCFCVQHSGYVVRWRREDTPIDPDDVVIALSQISWKENSTCFQSLCTRCYIFFPSGLMVWLVLNLRYLRLWLHLILRSLNSVVGCNILWYCRQILPFRRVMLSTFQGRR